MLQLGDKGRNALRPEPDRNVACREINPLDQKLNDARLLGWKELLPERIELDESIADFGFADGAFILARTSLTFAESCKAKADRLQSITNKLNSVTAQLQGQEFCSPDDSIERKRLKALKEYARALPETYPCNDGVTSYTEPVGLTAWVAEQIEVTQMIIDDCQKQGR